MDRKNTLVSLENDKNKEELHITTALEKCGCPKWIFEKMKQDPLNKESRDQKGKEKDHF